MGLAVIKYITGITVLFILFEKERTVKRMIKNLIKATIIVSLIASMTGCSNKENLEVHTQKIEAEQVMVEGSEVDTTIPVLSIVEKTSIPKIELNEKEYVVSNKSDIEMLLEDTGLSTENYDDNIAISYDNDKIERCALGDMQRFKGLKINGMDMSMSMKELEDMGAEILNEDAAKLDGVYVYFKDGKVETVMIEL